MFSRRTTSRGFTLIELLIVIGVSSIVLGALGLLYTFSMSSTGDAMAEMSSTSQATTAMRDIAASVRNSMVCDIQTHNGQAALRCTMPASGAGSDADGNPVSYMPSTLDKFGREHFTAGQRVWYYLADATGAFGTTGKFLWRATRTDGSNPTASDTDKTWSLINKNASNPRFPLVSAFSASVDATNDLATVSLTADCADYADRQGASGDTAAHRRTTTISRQVFWENWRT